MGKYQLTVTYTIESPAVESEQDSIEILNTMIDAHNDTYKNNKKCASINILEIKDVKQLRKGNPKKFKIKTIKANIGGVSIREYTICENTPKGQIPIEYMSFRHDDVKKYLPNRENCTIIFKKLPGEDGRKNIIVPFKDYDALEKEVRKTLAELFEYDPEEIEFNKPFSSCDKTE